MLVRENVQDAAIGVGVADTPNGLDAITKPGCAAVIWRRQPPTEVQSWFDRMEPSHLPSARLILAPSAVPDAIGHLSDMSGLPVGSERSWLEADIADLATRFASLMKAPYLRVRLDIVTTNACRKFHIDAIRSRLICTYLGPGTQYGISTDGAAPTRVFQVATGAPMSLRGTLWPETPKSGLLHRSPPIAGTGTTRFVLVLDPIDDLEDEY